MAFAQSRLVVGLAIAVGACVADLDSVVDVNVDWESFLARADPTWTQPPTEWYEAGFFGNGKLGGLVSMDNSTRAMQLVIASTAIWDDRPKGKPYNFVPEDSACSTSRLPIGHFVLDGVTVGNSDFGMRVRLWDAEVTGSIGATADAGEVSWRILAHAVYAEADVLAIELTQNTTAQVEGNPAALAWRFVPAPFTSQYQQALCKGMPLNPPPSNASVAADGATVVTQMHLRGTEHATAFLTEHHVSATTKTSVMYVSISDVMDKGKGTAAALAAVRSAKKYGIDAITASHRKWWHEYYPRSFLTLSEPQIESFYWAQMYKIASATRADRPVYDLQGPWQVTETHWPDIHWDLNLQLTYQPMFTSNRLDLLESLTENLVRTIPSLINNVPVAWRNDSAAAPTSASAPNFKETCYNTGAAFNGTCVVATGPSGRHPAQTSVPQAGNLLWVMHLWHTAYVYKGYDETELAKLFPLLARAATYYSHITTTYSNETTGTLHIKPTKSPEYGDAPDANYDLSLLKWGLGALLDLADVAKFPAAVADPRLPLWRKMAAHLAPNPVDKSTGFLIGDGVPLARGHRHFSHLFKFWPLKMLNLPPAGGTADSALAVQSLDHWMGLGTLHGFSYTGSVPMNVMLGRKAAAFSNLTEILDKYLQPNTMYFEGRAWPCGETPPAAAAALMDMMLMEWQGVIRVFAGIDDTRIVDAAFAGLLAPGGFEVAARRAASATEFVQVTNAAGVLANRASAKLALFVDAMPLPWVAEPISVRFTARVDGSGIVDIDLTSLPQGKSVVFYSEAAKPVTLDIVPSGSGNPERFNYWGLPLGGGQ